MEHKIDPLLGIIAPFVNFTLFIILAFIFFKKPILNAIATKRKTFEKAAREAALARETAEKELQATKKEFDSLNSKIMTMKQEAKLAAEAEAKAIVEQARMLATNIEKDAKSKIRNEVQKAKSDLRSEIGKVLETTLREQLEAKFKDSEASEFNQKQVSSLEAIN